MAIFQDNRQLRYRMKWIGGFFLLGFVVLFAKLWHLTVVKSERYRELAERNRLRTVPAVAPRGLVFDREGRVLVDNIQSVNLVLFRDELRDVENTLDFLVQGMGIDRETLLERLETAHRFASYHPLVVKEDLSIEELGFFLAQQSEHPELGLIKQPRRIYRYGELAAHVLGYVGEVSQPQLESREFAHQKPGDIVGQYGIERSYNRWLTGRDGFRRVLVNSLGKPVQELDGIEAVEGKPLKLALDLELQMVAEAELENSRGAVVALDPHSGEILVMASRPAFNPNYFAVRISRAQWLRLISDPDHPLQNRALQSTFSPGSVFKMVVALAGLELGVVDQSTSVYCGGGTVLYRDYFRCWKEGGHGWVNLRQSIQQSCNVYYYLLGQKLGIEQIAGFSRRVGLGIPTGIDLYGEASGLVPSDEWKRRVVGQPWYAGETISVSIGQGPVNVTPLQLARAVGIIATGAGPSPRLVADDSERSQSRSGSEPLGGFEGRNLESLREAMWSVVNEWGTGWAARVAGFEVCGKTGTAQTISLQARSRLSPEEAERFLPNAWFVGFAPRDDPEIAVAVIVQRGGGGGSAAAPIARKILERYYEKKRHRGERMLEVAWNEQKTVSERR